jgi:hypothetical protein
LSNNLLLLAPTPKAGDVISTIIVIQALGHIAVSVSTSSFDLEPYNWPVRRTYDFAASSFVMMSTFEAENEIQYYMKIMKKLRMEEENFSLYNETCKIGK